MQGKQNMSNTERKGPHKSMHCKFCKPPGVVTPEKPTRAQIETKTRIHLAHEGADLRLTNTHNEPGFPKVESEACICVLEGENPCPKCVPDKNWSPPKKKVCKCPKGAKPHPSMFVAAPEKKRQVEEDDEFWWEKYSREHDALTKETWEAYMAHRRKEKKLEKCKKLEKLAMNEKDTKGSPNWYQKLSCQQMIYVEHLSTAIRLDSDEHIIDRTNFILAGIGLYPRPKRSVLKRCLRFCNYNSIRFLNQLHIVIKEEDPFGDKPRTKTGKGGQKFTWNERLVMSCLCYLEFPTFLRELMDRLPQLKRQPNLPQIPYPVFPLLPKKKYEYPYEEPIWQDRLNWIEKMKIDRLNRCRVYMETKRVKIPALALVRRPSLVDARPPFLAQIEANERASRRLVKEKRRKTHRKHPISTFNSAVDVTAIAGIEASEISATEKADTDDICVFLRDPKETESTEGEIEAEAETEEEPEQKEVKLFESPCKQEVQINRMNGYSDSEENFTEKEEPEIDDKPFKTPPKTESGATIGSPCPPPDGTPGPPATHFNKGKRELDIINKEICGFFPFVASSTWVMEEGDGDRADDVESNLKSAAEKLKELVSEDEGGDKSKKKSKKKHKKKEKRRKRRPNKKAEESKSKKCVQVEGPDVGEGEEEALESSIEGEKDDEDREEGDLGKSFSTGRDRGTKRSKRSSEISDPDPDTDDEWSARPPCVTDSSKEEIDEEPIAKRKLKKRKGKRSRRNQRKKKSPVAWPKEQKREYPRKRYPKTESTTEGMAGDEDGRGKEPEEKKAEVFTGDIWPLVEEIIKDLEEEGFYCASYPNIVQHPDVEQLIQHLKGKIVNRRMRKVLHEKTKHMWAEAKGLRKFGVRELGTSQKTIETANWNDKKWISRLAKMRKDQFYYKAAKHRSDFAVDFYKTLHQQYLGTERYLKIFYAYMPSKFEDTVLRGIV